MKPQPLLRLDPGRATDKDALAHNVKLAAWAYWEHCTEGFDEVSRLGMRVKPLRPVQLELSDGTVLLVSFARVAPGPDVDQTFDPTEVVDPPPERPVSAAEHFPGEEGLVEPGRPDADPPKPPAISARKGEVCPECGTLSFRVEANHFSTRICVSGHRWKPAELVTGGPAGYPLGIQAPIDRPVDTPSPGTIPTEAGGHTFRNPPEVQSVLVGNPPRPMPTPSVVSRPEPSREDPNVLVIKAIQAAAEQLREAAKLLASIKSK